MNDCRPQAASCRLVPLLELIALVEHALVESGFATRMHLVLPAAAPEGRADRLVCGQGGEVQAADDR